MERLALRVLSSRADSFSGSICFISTDAKRGEGCKENKKQSEKGGDLILKLDSIQ